jgi:hypothetical protein
MKQKITHKIRVGRTICLVDIENCVGTSAISPEQVEAVRLAISRAAPNAVMKVVACSHHNACSTMFGFIGARVILRSGPDGADLALLDVIEHEQVDGRFGKVIIASGDGIFAPACRRLRSCGVYVEVLSLPDRLSGELAASCSNVRYLTLSEFESGNV